MSGAAGKAHQSDMPKASRSSVKLALLYPVDTHVALSPAEQQSRGQPRQGVQHSEANQASEADQANLLWGECAFLVVQSGNLADCLIPPTPLFARTGSPHTVSAPGQRACEEVTAVAQRDDRVCRVGREEPDVALRIVLCRALVSKCRVWVSALVAYRPQLHLWVSLLSRALPCA